MRRLVLLDSPALRVAAGVAVCASLALVISASLGQEGSGAGSSAGGNTGSPKADQAGTQTGGEDSAMDETAPTVHYRQLTPEERRVIVDKGTEAPLSGEYDSFSKAGAYTCKRCGAMLYRSEDKFDSGCGWPAFDDAIPGAVERVPDADGVRTEIECANCGAHLGHVFTGEELTPKDTRYCVNSISMLFVPADEVRYGRAIFAGGCFWGVEHYFRHEPGVIETTVGYTGGTTDSPTYERIHGEETGHAEAVEVIFDPVRVSFEQLAKLFFEIHDPTQLNRQGPDVGTTYRSAVFCVDDEQTETTRKLIDDLKGRGMDVVTQVVPAGEFWPAEDYHQDYFERNGLSPTCHVRTKLW